MSFLDALLEGIQVISPDWRYLHINATAARHARMTASELLGRTMMECYPGIESTPLFATLRACMSERHAAILENTFTYPDGSVGDFELRVEPVPQGICILSLDISERRRAAEVLRKTQDQLRHVQKMEAIGRLAGGIAHDFNNILSVVLSYAELGLLIAPAASDLRHPLEEIRKAGRRAAGLTHQLLAYSRRQVLELKSIDLNSLLHNMSDMLRRLVGADVEVALMPGADLWTCEVDVSQMEQVIMNVVVNARDAMPQGGQLTIETANAHLDCAYAELHAEVIPGDYVMLAVTDNGFGMDKETQARIFEPFFTTKAMGKGTGLGLATVFGIIRQSHGHLWVYSEPGQGTTFKVYLPRQHRAVPAAPAPSSNSASVRGSETILVVDDDEQLRQVATAVLEKHGYRVLTAAQPEQALQESDGYAEPIHLLLTDVVMPKMNGRQLAERLRQARPHLRVLYMTGYTENAIVHHGVLKAGVQLLPKPLTPDSLLRRVREVLNLAATVA